MYPCKHYVHSRDAVSFCTIISAGKYDLYSIKHVLERITVCESISKYNGTNDKDLPLRGLRGSKATGTSR